MLPSDKKDRQEEVKEARERFKKEGFTGFFIKPTLEYWKKNPVGAIFDFVIWALIFYVAIVGVQALYFDTIYCDCNIDTYDGKLMDVYNPFVAHVNAELAKQNTPQFSVTGTLGENFTFTGFDEEEILLNMASTYNMTCGHNLTRYWEEPGKLQNFLNNFIKVGLKRS